MKADMSPEDDDDGDHDDGTFSFHPDNRTTSHRDECLFFVVRIVSIPAGSDLEEEIMPDQARDEDLQKSLSRLGLDTSRE